jgi:putative polyhydroxyalkanoate system protein
MANFTASIPHQLGRAEARRRIEEQVNVATQQYPGMVQRLDQRWEGDTLHFTLVAMGQSVSGLCIVEDQAVRLEVQLPWMLAMLAGSVRQQIETQGRQLLGHRP